MSYSMKLSDEERKELRLAKKAKINELRKKLSELSEDQRNAIAEKYGIVTVEGHPLTPHNQCFLVAQGELNFTIVAGYKQWQKSGRSVRKGEHGFLIFVPSIKKSENSSEEISSDDNPQFFTATVFDISQTELINKKSEAA